MKVNVSAHDGWIVEPIEERHLAVAGVFERLTEQVEVHFADTPVFCAPSDLPTSASGMLDAGRSASPTHHDGKSVFLNTNFRVKAAGLVSIRCLVPEINFFDVGYPRNTTRRKPLNGGRTIRVHSLFPDDRYIVVGKTEGEISFGSKLNAASMLEPLVGDVASAEGSIGIATEFKRDISVTSIRAHGTLSSTASWEIFRGDNDLDATIPLWVGLLVPKDATELEFEMRLTVHSWRMPFGVPLETEWVSFKSKLPAASSPMPTEELSANLKQEILS